MYVYDKALDFTILNGHIYVKVFSKNSLSGHHLLILEMSVTNDLTLNYLEDIHGFHGSVSIFV